MWAVACMQCPKALGTLDGKGGAQMPREFWCSVLNTQSLQHVLPSALGKVGSALHGGESKFTPGKQ